MNDKEAANILLNLSKKYSLTDPEKEAIDSAIGILSWTCLAKNRIKIIKNKRNNNKL